MIEKTTASRIPLIWLLVPMMIGLAIGHTVQLGNGFLFLCVSAVLFGSAIAFNNTHKTISLYLIAVAGISLGFGHILRLDSQNEIRENYPPRQTELTLSIQRIFNQSSGKVNGIGTIVDAPNHLKEIEGIQLYFSLFKDDPEIILSPSAHITALAVLEHSQSEDPTNGFHQYLNNIGVWGSFTRGPVLHEVKQPNAYHIACAQARNWIKSSLHHGLDSSKPYASTYIAMTLGLRSELTRDQKDVFLKSGTMHLFAISGLHIGIIAACIHALLQVLRLPRIILPIISLLLIAAFVSITGGSASAWRALLMIACYYLCQANRMQSAPLNALILSCLICLIIDPRQLFQAGFQMSYGTVSVILLYGVPLASRANAAWRPFSQLPKVTWRFYHHVFEGISRYTINLFCIGLSTSLVSGLFSITYFNTLPIAGILMNFILLPAASLAIIAGFCSLFVSILQIAPLAMVFNNAAGFLLLGIEACLNQLTAWRLAYLQNEGFNTTVLLAIACLIVVALSWGYSKNWPIKLRYLWLPPIASNLLAIFIAL